MYTKEQVKDKAKEYAEKTYTVLPNHHTAIQQSLKQKVAEDAYIQCYKDWIAQPQPKKPLSEITDEDAIEVAKLANMDVAKKESLTDVEVVSVNEFGVIEVMCWEKTNTEYDEWDTFPFFIDTTGKELLFYDHMGNTSNPVKVIDFLRSRGYDIPNNYSPLPQQDSSEDWDKIENHIAIYHTLRATAKEIVNYLKQNYMLKKK